VVALATAELPVYPDTIMDAVDASLSTEQGRGLSSAEMLVRDSLFLPSAFLVVTGAIAQATEHLQRITQKARARVEELGD